MTIEIHQPELEALIHRRMASGGFCDVTELLITALHSMQEPLATKDLNLEGKNLFEIAAPIRGLFTDDEIETMFGRDSSPGRTVDCA